jgi:elongation of very long chain fatty acids protein 6
MSFEEYADEPVMIDGYYRSRAGLNYSYLFFYEKKYFNDRYVESKKDWMRNSWHLSILYAFIYIVAVFLGQWYMKSRAKYDLRRALIAWNFVLAVFSFIGTVRIFPEFYHTIVHKGIDHSVCNNDYTHGVSGCWAWLFILSKVPELIDTLFIILRKQELIFLHWYHHATVLIYCWYSCKDFTASGRWFVFMNYTVHACMYTYYGFRALRFKIPRWVNVAITSGQISQMIIGIFVNLTAYYKKKRGEECAVTDENIKWSFIMYFSYFLLFFHFFYNAYIVNSKKKTQQQQQQQNGSAIVANGKAYHQNGIKSNGNGHHVNGEINNNNNNSNGTMNHQNGNGIFNDKKHD